MAKLTTAGRKALPGAKFAGPGRSYPVPDRAHAANAKAPVDRRQDKADAKKAGMSQKRYEGSAADRKADAKRMGKK